MGGRPVKEKEKKKRKRERRGEEREGGGGEGGVRSEVHEVFPVVPSMGNLTVILGSLSCAGCLDL